MASPDNNGKNKDELFWLFPVFVVVALIGAFVIARPSGCGRGDAQTAGVIIPGYGPAPEGAPAGQISAYQAEDIPVIAPEHDGSGVRTVQQIGELLQMDIYQGEEKDPTQEEMDASYIESTTPGPGFKIVFRSDIDEEGNSDIYMCDETGYNPTRLTTWESTESFPSITTDGSRVYFVSDRDDDPNNPNPFTKNTEIYYIDMELFNENGEAEPERLTYNNTTDFGVSVNADATSIVYMAATKEDPDNPVMYLADGDAHNEKVIADTALHNCIPKISGDGEYVVYNSFLFGRGMDIFLYYVDDNFHVNLTNSDVPEFFPSINYDGSRIIFEKLLMGSPQYEDYIELHSIDRHGNNESQITFNRFADTFPALTDDGNYMVFVSKRWDFDGDSHPDEAMFYMDMSDGETYKITKDPFYEEQPDL
jgi:Tol biopolymer transport system component